MKVLNIVKKYLFLSSVVLCLLPAGCAGKDTEKTDMESWSFQTFGEEAGAAGQDAGFCETDREEPGSLSAEVQTENEPGGYVYVCGAVHTPGVYEITEGMRVFEVVAMAGGMTPEADPDWINQALTVSDGQQLWIYTREETQQMRESGLTAESGRTAAELQKNSDDSRININTADRDLLMTLPGIGEAKADAILKYRQEHGRFDAIEDICQISGIKDAVFSNIKDRITV